MRGDEANDKVSLASMDSSLLDVLRQSHDVEAGLSTAKAAAQHHDVDATVYAADHDLDDALAISHDVEAGLSAVKKAARASHDPVLANSAASSDHLPVWLDNTEQDRDVTRAMVEKTSQEALRSEPSGNSADPDSISVRRRRRRMDRRESSRSSRVAKLGVSAADEIISARGELRLVVPRADVLVDVTLSYSITDPFAVRMNFPTAPGSADIEWMFGRDLLAGGLQGPIGGGDVRIWPSLDEELGPIYVELWSPSGRAVFAASRSFIVDFVKRTVDLVPLGGESYQLDGEIWAVLNMGGNQ